MRRVLPDVPPQPRHGVRFDPQRLAVAAARHRVCTRLMAQLCGLRLARYRPRPRSGAMVNRVGLPSRTGANWLCLTQGPCACHTAANARARRPQTATRESRPRAASGAWLRGRGAPSPRACVNECGRAPTSHVGGRCLCLSLDQAVSHRRRKPSGEPSGEIGPAFGVVFSVPWDSDRKANRPRISGLGEDVEDLLDYQNRLAAYEDAQLKVPASDPGGGHVGTSDIRGTRI